MFEDSFVESSAARHHDTAYSATLSFIIQTLLVGVLVLLPLLHIEGLPKNQLSMLIAPLPPQASATEHANVKPARDKPLALAHDIIRVPSQLPKFIGSSPEEPERGFSLSSGIMGSVPGALSNGALSGGAAFSTGGPSASAPKLALPSKARVSSGVAEGLLIHKVLPQYPILARQARIQGAVVLQAVIGKDGTVKNLQILSGHPMLLPAAMQAVKQWRYRPYFLNGEAVEVDTQITVNFTLAGG